MANFNDNNGYGVQLQNLDIYIPYDTVTGSNGALNEFILGVDTDGNMSAIIKAKYIKGITENVQTQLDNIKSNMVTKAMFSLSGTTLTITTE